MQLGLNEIISLLIVFVSLLFAVFLVILKGENFRSNLLIIIFLVLNAIDADSIFLSSYILPAHPGWGMLIKSTVFLKMPLIYLYILSVIYSDFRIKPVHLLHCLLFVIITVILIPKFYMVDVNAKLDYLETNQFKQLPEIKLIYILLHVQIAAYLLLSFLAVRKYRILLLQNYSNASMFHYKWLFQFISIYALAVIVVSFKNLFLFTEAEKAFYYTLLLTSLLVLGFICWMVLKALQSPELFRGIDSKLQLVATPTKINQPNNSDGGGPVTQKDSFLQDMIDRLTQHMSEKEPYLDASLTTYSLAQQMNMPVRDLSLLINRDLEQHFFDFINGYRIKKAMQLLQDPRKEEFTVLEILYDVGFNSKSSFNTYFKKYTHLTPTEYRKKHLNSIA